MSEGDEGTDEFALARRGLVASEPELAIRADDGTAVWDADDYAFLDGDTPPATVHPGLWRQAQRNQLHGLFEVAERIHQVRGYDLANMTLIAGDTGWIVVDPLTVPETARAALALADATLGARPVVAVIYTHSHVDHFGGAPGVVSAEDAAAGRVRVIAPDGFLEAAISENVLAGNAMARRADYMYGSLLPRGPRGHVDAGLGKGIPHGLPGLVAPNELVTQDGAELTIDGLRFVFQLAPDSEAPAELHFHLPQLRALCIAENCTCTLHNLYTLRGAQVRDALAWSGAIDTALERFGGATDVVFAGHHWPRWGANEVEHFLSLQRDLYRYLHDETLRLANRGHTMDECAELVQLPPALRTEAFTAGFYGTVSHNVKGVYQRYLGWFDGNPAHLHPLPQVERAKRTVAYMGGAAAVLARAREDLAAGELRWVAQVVNDVVFAEPDNAEARELQADVLERLGFQAESAPWRDFYLSGAHELRHGVRPAAPLVPASFVAQMPVTMVFDFLGVRLDGPRAADRRLTVNWHFTDRDERYVLRMRNGALTHVRGRLDPDADVTVTLTHAAFVALLLVAAGVAGVDPPTEIAIDGRPEALGELMSLLDAFTPDFPLVTR
ncbi:alkyl/aryl-sulfatase [Conexibacter sp. CPCC 206217]|uniref:alkyl/aryl-sulfatase n=1 Tax=Conexibacter sp. CPCC 206217 TaxID=3064574 RepID=UPI002720AC7B|nr:alkyl sulfatase dimerization domain-containing protein [Conexibacter sp. CPCC 206217]MDO8212487.1 alkyl sulfatase dimerization domain-containing protein [Conexibacter sp. CPCC 206217]